MLEIKLYLATGTTLNEIRAFVKATEGVRGDQDVIRFNFQDEMDALGAAVDIDG